MSLFFNAQHSPIGAFSSFTLGARGAKGGLGVELGKPSDQNIFVGIEDAEGVSCLPFFDQVEDESTRFDVEAAHVSVQKPKLKRFHEDQITRTLSPGCDRWVAGDLNFAIYTPVQSAPDPATAREKELKLAYVPALTVEITVDNRLSDSPRHVIFGFQGNDPFRGMRRLDNVTGIEGIASGDSIAIAGYSSSVTAAQGFTVEDIITEAMEFNYGFAIGSVAILRGLVPAEELVTFRFVVCFYRGGTVTTGMEAEYFYTRFFPNIESVASYALRNFEALKVRGADYDKKFWSAPLNDDRKFMLAHAIHSYYGSTQFLQVGDRPMWIVNEGEYRMINTFDLTVDQLFFEMELNPWTVKNELDWFVRRYSYTDTVSFPGDDVEYPGGLSFTHDMGVANYFSRTEYSVYEKAGLHGCFSHMTHEELVNWVVCALTYEAQTKDSRWLKKRLPIFEKALTSMMNRDHPDPAQRDGVMSLDSSRCAGGSEITTYDSLDVSLGQARNNLYLAGKCWGSYVGLASLFDRLGDKKRANLARDQAHRAAESIAGSANEEGLLPAILHENVASRIIPAVEGLIIPHVLGLKETLSEKGPYSALIFALKKHTSGVLQPGVCLFSDGGWKISSTSDNSWLSKVYLCQFIVERILKTHSAEEMSGADRAHASWLLHEENLYWAWSDQMISGIAKGSKYYPRGVTAALWLEA